MSTLPALATPEPKEPTRNQLAYVQYDSLWWPAVVYESAKQAMAERHAGMSIEAKAFLGVKIIDSTIAGQDQGGKVANLLGFNDKWVDAETHRDIFIFMALAEEQPFDKAQRSRYIEALHQARSILRGGGVGTATMTAASRSYDEDKEHRRIPMVRTKSLVSNKRRSDEGRIWGREPAKKKRIVATKITASQEKKPPKKKAKAKAQKPSSTSKKLPQRQQAKQQAKKKKSAKSREDFYVWSNLWPHLREIGWKVKKAKNHLHDWYWYPPHVTPESGEFVYDKDFFGNTAYVIEWARSNNLREKIGVTTSSDESAAGTEDEETLNSADDEMSRTDEDTYMSTDDERSQASSTKKKYVWKEAWPLLKKEGWKLVSDGLGTWCYAKPDVDIATAVSGEDYFKSIDDLLEWVHENDYMHKFLPEDDISLRVQGGDEACTPTDCRTKPQDPAKPLLESDSSSSEDEEYRFNFKNLWPRLQKYGWKYVSAYKYNKLHDNYYVRPSRSVAEGKLGVDYFLSFNDVIRFEKQQEGLLDEEDLPLTQPADNRRVTMSPRAIKTAIAPKKNEWWQLYPVPGFTTGEYVWKILRDKLNFRYMCGMYCLPSETMNQVEMLNLPHRFRVDHDMRAFLCKHGIPNYAADKLTPEERTDLIRWITFANVPVNSTSSVQRLKDVTVLAEDQATRLLSKIKFKDLGTGRHFHEPTKQVFDSFTEMRCFVRGMEDLSTGRRRSEENSLSDHETLQLRLWAALSPEPLPVFGEIE